MCFHSRLAAGDSRDGRGGRAARRRYFAGVPVITRPANSVTEPEIASGECSVVMVEEQGVVEVRLDCGALGNHSDGAIRLAWVR